MNAIGAGMGDWSIPGRARFGHGWWGCFAACSTRLGDDRSVPIEPFIVTLGTMGIFRAFTTFRPIGGSLPIDRSLREGPIARISSATSSAFPYPVLIRWSSSPRARS